MRHRYCKINSHGRGKSEDEELPISFLNTSVYVSLAKANHMARPLLLPEWVTGRKGELETDEQCWWPLQWFTCFPHTEVMA